VPEVNVPVVTRERSSLLPLGAALAALLVGVLGFFYRFNALGGGLGGFGNDHFIHLSRARQILAGELPFRDFSDPGAPLTSLTSAAVQGLFGYNLYGEAVLTVGAISLGAAITTWLAARLSGRVWPGVLVGLLQIALAPRLYNYAKVFLFACGIWAAWRYVDGPRGGRLLLLAVVIATGFLFRHDYAIYLGLLGALTVALTHRAAVGLAFIRTAALTAATLVLLVPFFLFLLTSGGVLEYFRQSAEFAKADTARTSFRFPTFDVLPSAPLVSVAAAEAPPPPHVNVRWADTMTEETRLELERTHGLVGGEHREGTTWTYELADTSTRNLEALVRDPRVLDTHGIDRTAYRPAVPQPEEGLSATLARVRLAPELTSEDNAVAWLYYTLVALPICASLAWLWRLRSPAYDRARVAAAIPYLWPVIVMMALLAVGFLSRGTTEARLADVGVPAALLAAWIICARNERAVQPRRAPRRRPLAALAAALIVFVSAWSVAVVGAVRSTADRSGFLSGSAAAAERYRIVRHTLSATPPVFSLAGDERTPLARLALWVGRCTPPRDRLLVVGNLPELYFFSGRLMAGGHVWFVPGYGTSRAAQEQTLARIRAHRVPLVLTDVALYDTNYRPMFPLVDEYVQREYERRGTFPFDDGAGVGVYVARNAGWTGTDADTGLPCAAAGVAR
jgi:hypothetical protein